MVSYHRVWSYFFDWVGLQYAGVIEDKPGIPASPIHVTRLVKTMRARPGLERRNHGRVPQRQGQLACLAALVCAIHDQGRVAVPPTQAVQQLAPVRATARTSGPVEHPVPGPAVHPGVDGVPVADPGRQPPPLAAMLGDVQDGVEHLQVRQADVAALHRQGGRNAFVLSLGDLHPQRIT